MLRKHHEQDVVLATPGIVRAGTYNPAINVVLFLATVLTTLFTGAMLAGANPLRNPAGLLTGAPFAFTLLGILGVHELGHYFVGRRHGVAVTLPYFIPVPFGLGTFGAFIQMKSPVTNKKALFDVGIAGPLAGFLVAVPLLVAGLLLSPIVRMPGGTHALGSSLLVEWITTLVRPHPAGYAVFLNPVAFAAWFGLLVTGINLLPIGQLDGGHIAYALFGGRARYLGWVVVVALVVMGLTFWQGWLTWAFLAFLFGVRHPAPLDEITELNAARRLLGLLTLGLLFLLITPAPF